MPLTLDDEMALPSRLKTSGSTSTSTFKSNVTVKPSWMD